MDRTVGAVYKYTLILLGNKNNQIEIKEGVLYLNVNRHKKWA